MALANDGRYVAAATGGGEGCDNGHTLHWNVAQDMILRRRAELIAQGWLPDA